jgi:predicted DNA-binding transcriptional regulator YafY
VSGYHRFARRRIGSHGGTVYRNIATLKARRIRIEVALGIGYVLPCGFELPPLMFTEDEAEAIAVGVHMLARIGECLS